MENKRLDFIKSAAVQTGKLLLDHFYNGNRQGELKADRTLVTKADQNADLLLQNLIKEKYPDDGILSEEGSTVFPENDHVWVLDPLDGTVNFSLGLHYWGVSISHLKNGVPQTAAVYFPVVDELFSASRAEGAELNGTPLLVSNPPVDSPYPVFVHCSRMHDKYQVKLPYKTRSLGVAAYHLCLITKGTAALAFESTPKLWDFAGSWLIVEEAGGLIRAYGERQPFPAQPGIKYSDHPYAILASASSEGMREAVAGIRKK
jgi:myo-inositol-1(or 4)-monophosphatase